MKKKMPNNKNQVWQFIIQLKCIRYGGLFNPIVHICTARCSSVYMILYSAACHARAKRRMHCNELILTRKSKSIDIKWLLLVCFLFIAFIHTSRIYIIFYSLFGVCVPFSIYRDQRCRKQRKFNFYQRINYKSQLIVALRKTSQPTYDGRTSGRTLAYARVDAIITITTSQRDKRGDYGDRRIVCVNTAVWRVHVLHKLRCEYSSHAPIGIDSSWTSSARRFIAFYYNFHAGHFYSAQNIIRDLCYTRSAVGKVYVNTESTKKTIRSEGLLVCEENVWQPIRSRVSRTTVKLDQHPWCLNQLYFCFFVWTYTQQHTGAQCTRVEYYQRVHLFIFDA